MTLSTLNKIELDIIRDEVQTYEFDNDQIENIELLLFIIEKLKKSEYLQILSHSSVQEIINKLSDGSDWREKVISSVQLYLNESNHSYVAQLTILLTGIASLQYFVTQNWTGPFVTLEPDIFPRLSSTYSATQEQSKWVKACLSQNGDAVYTLLRCPETLLFAKIILDDLREQLEECITIKWWLLRCLRILQLTMSERSPLIYSTSVELINECENSNYLTKTDIWQIKVQLQIEAALIFVYYHEVTKAKHHLSLAQDIAGLDIQLTSALGTRTYFQQKPLPQLLLKVKRSDKNNEVISSDVPLISNSFLKDIKLQDDTVLNHVKFLNEDENKVETLFPHEQIIVLLHSSLAKRIFSVDFLMVEELMTYLDFLLAQTTVWSVKIQSLMLRCKLEKNSSRRVERAMTQMQELVDATAKDMPSSPTRLYLFYSTEFPSFWMMEKELAELFVSLGVIQGALEIFLRLELWEDAVDCYKRLQRRQKAEKLIRELLQAEETPLLWCLLGDAIDNPDCYFKAWELSNQRNSRAQKSLGNLFVRKKQFKESILHFEKSLEINHLQLDVWFSLAYAATQAEEYEIAAKAYRTVVGLDGDNFEAWNNLSNAYIKMKQKQRAWKALQEALKCNYEEWRVWENYLLVCVDVGDFEDVVKAWHRLIDIKGKHMDEEILAILVNAVIENMPDIYGHGASRLRKKTLELLGRITSGITNNAVVWHLYAKLCLNSEEKNQQTVERALQYFQKAYRCSIQQPNWQKDASLCKALLNRAKELAEAYLACEEFCSNETLSKQLLSSARLMLINVTTPVSKQLCTFPHEISEELKSLIIPLDEYLEKINLKM